MHVNVAHIVVLLRNSYIFMGSDNMMEQNENKKYRLRLLKACRDYYNTTKMHLRAIRVSLVVLALTIELNNVHENRRQSLRDGNLRMILRLILVSRRFEIKLK